MDPHKKNKNHLCDLVNTIAHLSQIDSLSIKFHPFHSRIFVFIKQKLIQLIFPAITIKFQSSSLC
jgi:hypothetical protein